VEGRPPYERNGAWATLNAVVRQDPDPPELSGPLWPVLSELMLRDPDRRLRPQVAGQMLRKVAETVDPEGTIPLGPGEAAGAAVVSGLAEAEETRVLHREPGVTGQAASAPDTGVPAPTGPAPGLLPGSRPGPAAYRTADPRRAEGSRPVSGSPGSGPGRRGFWLGVLVAVLLVIAGGVALALSQIRQPGSAPGSGQHSGRGHGSSASPGGGQQGSGQQGSGQQGSGQHGHGQHGSGSQGHSPPGQQGQSGGPGGTPALPAGYHRYRDPTGFSIGIPPGWSVSHQGHYVYVRPAGSGGEFLLIDQTDHPKPDPLADWRQQEAARRSTYADYHLIRLAAVKYAEAERSADWEFTYTGSGGPTHVLNRNVLANPGHAYALYWSTPAGAWATDYHYFQAFAATFRPAGGVAGG
jgi:eukaryotic-like serine/threonine-protein kinase